MSIDSRHRIKNAQDVFIHEVYNVYINSTIDMYIYLIPTQFQEENERLKKAMSGGGALMTSQPGMTPEGTSTSYNKYV